ncbi:MAG: alpha-L-fucosidase [Acidobacteriia bacterium]|nr:alpha-L-fucosidase [Terriglobia bacterium]
MGQSPATPPEKYKPDWMSLRRHPVPKWFQDAKFGIFIHWGLYSVPAWAPTLKGPKQEIDWEQFTADPKKWFRENPYAEWYLNSMKIEGSPTWKHHRETYGEKFDYLDFIPTFNREVQKWNPDEWAALFREVGARYVVLITKHHDGFTLWPSSVHNPHRRPDQQGAQRDIVGNLTKAVRAQGLKMGLYYSGGLDWSFVGAPILVFSDLFSHVPQSEEYANYADAQWRELIDRYQPSVLWDDISYPKKGDVLDLFADYYNRVPDGIINDRFQVEHSDFTTPEYTQYSKIVEKKWETCRGLGFSFGYNQAEGPEQVLSAGELVRLLVDIVSKNGNLLLNIGPKPDGTIPQIQVERLRALGEWLRMNGEAIYETRPWVWAEGRTRDGVGVRFTQKGDSVYAILLDKPQGREITIESLWADPGTRIQMLGAGGDIPWLREGKDLRLTLPEQLPGSYAYVLKITPRPWKLLRE